MLANVDAQNYLKGIIEYAIHLLNVCPELKSVTKEQFDIMNMPDGELYDKSLIESAIKQLQDAAGQSANLKKENKMYSYKEQLADAELRKELDKKKKKELENQKFSLEDLRAKMSKKQQEMLDQQVAKEKNIRDEMRTKYNLINKVTCILAKAIEGNPFQARNYFSLIVSTLSKFLKSVLCIMPIAKVFNEIAKTFVHLKKKNSTMLYSQNFLNSVVNCSLRLTGTPISIEARWLDESLHNAYKRICKQLKAHVEIEIEKNNFDFSICSLFYPLLKVSFLNTQGLFDNCYTTISSSLMFRY